MVPSTRLVPALDEEVAAFSNLNVSYRRAIGSLNYLLVSTRLDIAFAVSQLSQYLERAGVVHWPAFQHLLQYLSGTKNYSICVGGGDSVFCYLVTWGDSIISWKAKKQATVSSSTTEAEYRALYDGVQEAVWLQLLLGSISGTSIYPINVYTNNLAALALSRNPIANQRTKHIDVKYHFIRKAVDKNWVKINYISMVVMPADGLTKALANPKHSAFLSFLKMKIQELRS
ncbi:hypothetical protein PCANC_18988 [Puccinia coronata f. sp. avenae]|uniref:Reverse transcriptase Ty1/copia-type domain-containing protein n=1 Tax=Puccinia coronata f. sp. avenae TaxID=200324 RepID=A0A2N5U3H0_9BASI|nr:hypothetical protein PCANC_18988 [Puccinia coronata f. sp. avenae]